MHKNKEQLFAEVDAATLLITLGGVYEHFKSADRYKVMGFIICEATEVVCVRYSKEDEDKLEFSRPVDNWLEEVDGAPRFRLIEPVPEA